MGCTAVEMSLLYPSVPTPPTTPSTATIPTHMMSASGANKVHVVNRSTLSTGLGLGCVRFEALKPQ